MFTRTRRRARVRRATRATRGIDAVVRVNMDGNELDAPLALSFDDLVRELEHEEWTRGEFRVDANAFHVKEAASSRARAGKTGTNTPGSSARGEQRAGAALKKARETAGGSGGARSAKATQKAAKGLCEVAGCEEPRSEHRGAGLCDKHRHAESFVIEDQNYGLPMRWCFYCHRAHDLGEFSAVSRSICTEKFTLRQGRRKEKRNQEQGWVAAVPTTSGWTKDTETYRGTGTGGSHTSTESEEHASAMAGAKTGSLRGGTSAIDALQAHDPMMTSEGYDVKFWVAHPRELQERMDMWDLVRRINSHDEPVGMYGTIVPGCVRFTVRGWASASEVDNLIPAFERRCALALKDSAIRSQEDLLCKQISVCEMSGTQPRRLDAHKGSIFCAHDCVRPTASIDVVFASAREGFEVTMRSRDCSKALPVSVRFFSEYIDEEISTSSYLCAIDPLSRAAETDQAVMDHVLSIQIGGYGAAYQHVAVIADTSIATELMAFDASIKEACDRERLRKFAMDYVWLSSALDSMKIYGERDVTRASSIADSVRRVLQAWGRAPHALARVETLQHEIEDIGREMRQELDSRSNNSKCVTRKIKSVVETEWCTSVPLAV